MERFLNEIFIEKNDDIDIDIDADIDIDIITDIDIIINDCLIDIIPWKIKHIDLEAICGNIKFIIGHQHSIVKIIFQKLIIKRLEI